METRPGSPTRDHLINSLPIRPRRQLPKSVPIPKYRHAAPSGPWPWQDLSWDEKAPRHSMAPPSPVDSPTSDHRKPTHWSGYPQALFPNWSPEQCQNSKISEVSSANHSRIHVADVDNQGEFHDKGVLDEREVDVWQEMQKPRAKDTRVRCLFVHQMSNRVLKMIGTKYEVEPFFFSSSINWIPSRYQENIDPQGGDHITIVLPFVRAIPDLPETSPSEGSRIPAGKSNDERVLKESHVIDTQAPLLLHSNYILIADQFAIHLVRCKNSSTMISYHQEEEWLTTPANHLHGRLIRAGDSVYWHNIFKWSPDPTFVLLATMWYPLYAWDEALELLSAHIIHLEGLVMETNSMRLVRQLHKIQANLLHYASLLANFRKSLQFLRKTPNPAMTHYPREIRDKSAKTLDTECINLKSEIDRLDNLIVAQQRRLKNVMDLEFATVNNMDMHATMKDSAAMVRISYLTAAFLPSSFIASCFGMNIKELASGTFGTTIHFAVTAIGFTCFSIWLIFAVQRRDSMMDGLKWPVRYFKRKIGFAKGKKRMNKKIGKDITLMNQIRNGIPMPLRRGNTFNLTEP